MALAHAANEPRVPSEYRMDFFITEPSRDKKSQAILGRLSMSAGDCSTTSFYGAADILKLEYELMGTTADLD